MILDVVVGFVLFANCSFVLILRVGRLFWILLIDVGLVTWFVLGFVVGLLC